MKIQPTATFSDLFDEEEPNIKTLLQQIPSKLIITILANINSELYLGEGNKTQIKLLERFIRRFENNTKNKILLNVSKLIKKNEELHLFTIKTNLEFIHHVLINYNNSNYEDSTIENELNILKAYFIFSKKINENYTPKNLSTSPSENQFFREYLWPIIIDQIEINDITNPFVNLIKGLNFLNHFQQDDNYSANVKIFLDRNNQPSIWNYILQLMHFLENAWKHETSTPFGFQEKDFDYTLFKSFILETKEYQKKYSLDKKNYTGLKDKPLIKIKESLIVLNWNFICNKLYEGLIFDFYNNSDINKTTKFSKFVNFKNYIAYEVTEKKLFRKIIEKYLVKNKSVLKFDDENIEGFPDAYYRYGKYIFVFEIKDAYFPANTISTYSHEKIKEVIDLKYNSESKGTSQLIKVLKKLKNKPLENKDYSQLKIKSKNLVIYPIMIFTDEIFESPGFNKYLIEEFNKKLEKEKLDNSFNQVKNLTFINLSFFINNLDRSKEIDFKNIIDYFHNNIKNIEKRNQKVKSIDLHHESNRSFEYFAEKYFNKNNIEFGKPIFKEVSELLELTKSLPD